MEENNLEKKENEMASNNNSNKNTIIAILIVIIIALIGAVIYFAFIKKDEPTTDDNGGNNQQINKNISVKKNLEVFAFNIILDTSGKAYLDLREENIDSENYVEITNLFKNAETYSYNSKNEKLVKIDLENVKDIQVFDFGNGGGKYIVFIDSNDKAYVLIDYKVEESGNVQLLTDDKLNNVSEINFDCDGDGTGDGGCSVFAKTEVNGEVEYIMFHDLFGKYE